ncbi:integrase core domain-containing protein [Paraburkholderia sp. SIMBA_027]|uniref:integrase core domain-containing protein n=1 Tax=Paraburkholderia sp. SIMBA_027 TaxID=3085770 RepID=UPI00397CF6DC
MVYRPFTEQLRQRGRRLELIQVDNEPEFVSKALDAWAHEHGVDLPLIRPGEPVENAHIESFNDRLRERCLKQHAFVSLDDARTPIKACRTDYNSVRPHSALRQLAPDQFRQLHQPKTGETTNLRMVHSAG